ncbi:SusD/RagB family nutrient-binding outer membrane lipoprotein [Pedobacter sp. KBW06]|uniref:SusD/RagB family nutrient-binding outer membrane lipoprotein n=1 Tax=Pedobacter sp. KBW06 TaxID=2153359 RepID=UPI000F59D048|nr:SusD/RagB family nutrient-binding outer membrane lipoprotein [Pedobacter sp. KBW06]RQO66426.1 SusD/RagB family nutrient-binding outer membrane lipoprotein [Pedobacter sp. KBW06]
MNIKKYYSRFLILSLLASSLLQSCDKGFEELNTDPNSSPTLTPAFVFTRAQLDGTRNLLHLLQGTMQYTTTFNDVNGFGSKYVLSQIQQTWQVFDVAYRAEINEITQVVTAVTGNPDQVNHLAMSRIWRAYCFSRVTDLYGDIPYFDAVRGYTDAIYKPKYDPQKDIYADLLKELEQAAAGLDPGKPNFGSADLIYGGDVLKWKKFAYSLMLRLAMRMTKVDPALAETWAKKAIAGGVITVDADIAKMSNYVRDGQDINKSPFSFRFWTWDYSRGGGDENPEGGKYQESFISYLRNEKDPRLAVVSVVWVKGVPDTTSAIQKGMPASLNSKPANFVTFSEPNPNTVLRLNNDFLLLTNAETSFLLAEAALRGWYNGASASVMYENGIAAAMRQWSLFGAGGVISTNQIQTYIKYHRLATSAPFASQMEQIYTQFWVGVFPDAQEVFSSYRRTGYPALIPNNYIGNATGGKIFRRMQYPVSEQNLNAENYNAVVARQGPDDLLTRIWWDRP